MKHLKKAWNKVCSFKRDEEGASGIEYALIAGMIAVALAAFVPAISAAVTTSFGQIQTALQNGQASGGGGEG